MQFKRITPRLPVADLRRTVEFYTQTLGFVENLLWPAEEPTFCILDRGDLSLSFFTLASRPDAKAIGGCDLYIEAEDVTGIHEALREKVKVEWGPEVYFYGCREFAVRDPDGYLLIFSEETDDPATCGEG
jgi:catechol 2,3-dioxygenase-like lactoylglutathione lyase family enzyme